jgi:predicted ATPase/predicted Ser/Thr protein kinase
MDRWATVKRIHQAALEREASQRAAFVDEACAGDEALRREVHSLLAYESQAESFLEAPAVDVTARRMNPEPAMLLVGRTLSHYRVESLLGAGGMGEVYLARDPRLERSVALKILPRDLTVDVDRLQRFIREAKAASALNHPNVATIYDVGESDGVRFIAMEHVEGQTLAARIAVGPLASSDIVDIGAQVADALDAAHARGITHRDIKPANLMLTPRGQAKVLDFGIAKTTWSEGATQTGELRPGSQTAVGVVIGSVPYMSPEQVVGHAVDHRSDLFSLGAALYEMATGRLPFAGATPIETMDRILHAQPEPLAATNDLIPAALERVIRKCLEKDAARRYQSARELLADFRQLQQTDADLTRTAERGLRRNNLPAQLTSFVGRDREVAEVHGLASSARLVTLTGAGGCGKTRLGLAVAAGLVDRFTDGVWAVDLAPLSEPALVPQTVAAVLDVREGQSRSLIDVLAGYLRQRDLLLLLDNCEHLIASCASLVETLLRAAPRLHVVATSREALGVDGEVVWRVPSLSLPDPDQPLALETASQCEAVRLLVERARLVQPAFAVTDASAGRLVEICRRLDGIPLAIELAAAKLKVLSVEQIRARLEDRFRLLSGGSRTALARQRTLEAAMTWSYELLSDAERRLLCRLSIFPGAWSLDAAEEICAGNGIAPVDIVDLLTHLADKSMVVVEDSPTGERRYRFLETVRQYGRERLVQSGETESLRDRHAVFFAQLARRAEPELRAADQVAWLNRLQLEHENLRSALEWWLAAPEHHVDALELASAIWWFWLKRGHLSEGRQGLERALAGAAGAAPRLRINALTGLWHMTYFRGDFDATERVLAECLEPAREAGDMGSTAFSLFGQALVAMERGDFDATAMLAAECETATNASPDFWYQTLPLFLQAYVAINSGDYPKASELYERQASANRRSGDTWLVCMNLSNHAMVRILQGQYADARSLAVEGIVLGREFGERVSTGWCLNCIAAADAAETQFARAVRLWGAIDAMQEAIGSAHFATTSAWVRDPYEKVARESLDARTFEAAWAEGHAMSLQQVIQYALAETSHDRVPNDASRRDRAE